MSDASNSCRSGHAQQIVATYPLTRNEHLEETGTARRSSGAGALAGDDPVDGRLGGAETSKVSTVTSTYHETMSSFGQPSWAIRVEKIKTGLKATKSKRLGSTYAMAPGDPVRVHCLSGPPASGDIWILQLVSAWRRLICSPPRPMIKPTILSGTLMTCEYTKLKLTLAQSTLELHF